VARTAASGTGPHSVRSSSRCAWRCSRFCTRCARRQRVRSGRPRLGSPLPHLHRDLARCCHTCAESGLTPATSATGTELQPCHICIGTGSAPATSAPGLPSSLQPVPHLRASRCGTTKEADSDRVTVHPTGYSDSSCLACGRQGPSGRTGGRRTRTPTRRSRKERPQLSPEGVKAGGVL
jgi:hypothetical protein